MASPCTTLRLAGSLTAVARKQIDGEAELLRILDQRARADEIGDPFGKQPGRLARVRTVLVALANDLVCEFARREAARFARFA